MERYGARTYLNAGIGGTVHVARDERSGETVAIKTMIKTEKTAAAIEREIKCAFALQHPGLVRTFGINSENGTVEMVQEYGYGGDLFEFLQVYGCVSHEETLKDLFKQILLAVAYMHKNGYCHRDLKPENVILLNDEKTGKVICKVIDFGMTECCRRVQGRAGTDAYAAPEVISIRPGEFIDGFSADIWSLGIILVALLCGRIPWAAADSLKDSDFQAFVERQSMGCRAAVFNSTPEELGLTTTLAVLLDSMLSLNPEQRPSIDFILDAINYSWIEEPCKHEFSSDSVSASDSGCSWGDLDTNEEMDFDSFPVPEFEPITEKGLKPLKADSGVSCH